MAKPGVLRVLCFAGWMVAMAVTATWAQEAAPAPSPDQPQDQSMETLKVNVDVVQL